MGSSSGSPSRHEGPVPAYRNRLQSSSHPGLRCDADDVHRMRILTALGESNEPVLFRGVCTLLKLLSRTSFHLATSIALYST